MSRVLEKKKKRLKRRMVILCVLLYLFFIISCLYTVDYSYNEIATGECRQDLLSFSVINGYLDIIVFGDKITINITGLTEKLRSINIT
ncbi:MAG: hypothetical protein QME35_02150 [Thermoanaerobacteraceae bacterium]|nr:hypothetical protein [Thermoanaerobacteraceae bacterium]